MKDSGLPLSNITKTYKGLLNQSVLYTYIYLLFIEINLDKNDLSTNIVWK